MARPLFFPSSSSSSSSSSVFTIMYMVFTVMGVLSVFSMVMYLCASHSRRSLTKEEVFGKGKEKIDNMLSKFKDKKKSVSVSRKALLKMISGRKTQQVQHGDEDDDHDDGHVGYGGYFDVENYDDDDGNCNGYYNHDHEEDDAVWKKTIIMGEKCRPIDFSGKIEYDSQGNLVHTA